MTNKKIIVGIFLVGLLIGGVIGGVVGYWSYEKYPPWLNEEDLRTIAHTYPPISDIIWGEPVDLTFRYPEHRNEPYYIIATRITDGKQRYFIVVTPGYYVGETMELP